MKVIINMVKKILVLRFAEMVKKVMTTLDKKMEPKKQKHKSKFRYDHDVIPHSLEFGATIQYENDEEHQFFQRNGLFI